MSFAGATSVVPGRNGMLVGRIHPGWDIFGIANGGYLMAIAARAMSEQAKGRELISINAHFTNPGTPGPVEVAVEAIKSGGSFTTLTAVVRGERPLITATASFAEPKRAVPETVIIHASAPDLPPPDQCVRAVPSSTGPLPPPFMDKVRVMIHPDDAAALRGERTGIARIRGWFGLLEDEPIDPIATILAADAFPPAVFNTNLPLKWTPTVEMTTYVRDPGPRTWLRCQFRTRFVTGGYLEEDGEMWDEDGTLVAQSRQLALVPR